MPRRLSTQDKELAELARRNLQRFREELGWTAGVMAERSGIPLDTYRQLERGQRRLTNAGVLHQLATACGHAMDDFYAAEPPPHEPAKLPCFVLRVLPGEDVDADIRSDLERAMARAEKRHRERRGGSD